MEAAWRWCGGHAQAVPGPARPRYHGKDAFERWLLGVSDGCYRLVIGLLQEQFGQKAGFSSQALNAMETVDTINHALVERGLLPPFTSV